MRTRSDAKRSDIIDVAAGVFLEQGFERASMAEIAARIGGSKTTLYGYFRSKEELFLAVAFAEADKQIAPAFAELDDGTADVGVALQRIGERLVTFLISPDAIAAHRMVVSEAGRNAIGRLFYENGRQRGIDRLAEYFAAASAAGKIRACDFHIAAAHILALFESEWLPPALFGIARPAPSRRDIRESTARAIEVFSAAYRTASAVETVRA